MKLTLNQEEIEVALKQYVGNNVSFKAGSDIKIEFTAGRGEKGLTAEIDIPYLGVTSIPAAAVQPAAVVTKRSTVATTAEDQTAADPAPAEQAAEETPDVSAETEVVPAESKASNSLFS